MISRYTNINIGWETKILWGQDMLIIAGVCIERKDADEIVDIVKTAIVSNRMRDLSHPVEKKKVH